jgi:hypothetical protein
LKVEINAIQIVIAILLIFVLFFGISFILNMLLKTTWFPIYIYIVGIIALLIFWDKTSWGTFLLSFKLVDYVYFITGILGIVIGGKAIETLRKQGYKMF